MFVSGSFLVANLGNESKANTDIYDHDHEEIEHVLKVELRVEVAE